MVGIWGMAPQPIDLSHTNLKGEALRKEQARIAERFEEIGMRMMNRTRGSADFQGDPIASVLRDPFKVRIAARFLGEAFVIAYIFVKHNKDAVEKVANTVLEKKEIFGDDLNRLLDSVNLTRPEIDWTKEETWPQI
jgi:hypothetical protein